MPGSRRVRLRGETGRHGAAAVASAHVAATLEDPRAIVNAPITERVNILLVDDQASRLLSYESILEELGQNLISARSGEEALQRLLEHDFAVVLLDVSMPGMDGFETAALIHDHPRFESIP